MPIKIGGKYKFDYPTSFITMPEYSLHRGLIVTVLREMIDGKEYDGPKADQELAYKVQAEDGWTGMAWECELRL